MQMRHFSFDLFKVKKLGCVVFKEDGDTSYVARGCNSVSSQTYWKQTSRRKRTTTTVVDIDKRKINTALLLERVYSLGRTGILYHIWEGASLFFIVCWLRREAAVESRHFGLCQVRSKL